jgi:hypothetical protein
MPDIQASTTLSGFCQQRSTWQLSGGVWKPIAPTVNGACTAPLRFLKGAHHFTVQPPDIQDNPEFQRLRTAFPSDDVVLGLDDATDKPAIDARFPGARQQVPGQAVPTFTLLMVPIGNNGLDISPLPAGTGSQ